MVAASRQDSLKPYPVKPLGMLAAIVVLGIVIFLSPPNVRLWIAGIVIVMALLQKGGDTAAIVEGLRSSIYGPWRG